MSIESVAEVETAAGFSARDAQALKAVRLVWQKLQKLRQIALKDDKATTQYKDLLVRSMAQARAQLPVEDDAAILQVSQEFWLWYDAKCWAYNVQHLEGQRGVSHAEWCEKWLPVKYQNYAEALRRFTENPSQQQVEELKAKAEAMLFAYVALFK